MIMENDPFVLIEGMIIAGLAVGADQGYIYLRSEYPHAQAILNEAIDIAARCGASWIPAPSSSTMVWVSTSTVPRTSSRTPRSGTG